MGLTVYKTLLTCSVEIRFFGKRLLGGRNSRESGISEAAKAHISQKFFMPPPPLRPPIAIGGGGRVSREIMQLFGSPAPIGGGGRNSFSDDSHFGPAALGGATRIWQHIRCMYRFCESISRLGRRLALPNPCGEVRSPALSAGLLERAAPPPVNRHAKGRCCRPGR